MYFVNLSRIGEKMINILFAGNRKVFDGMMISSLSIVKHTKCPINVFCMTMTLTELNEKFVPISNEQSKYLEKIYKDVNEKSTFTLLDMTDLFKREMINSVNIKSHFTPYAMLRLFADMLDSIPDKIIYLDTDTIINNDLQQLYDIDVENYEIGCVRDVYRISRTYFNTGVLLLNIKKIKETGLFAKAREMCLNKKMLYTDQAALNKCSTKKLILPLKFNAKDKYFKEIVVHHFCNVRKRFFHRIKPWEVELVKEKMNAYDDILDEYIERKAKLNT